MKTTITFLAILVPILAVTIWAAERAHASDSGACYAVPNPDARAYCLAKAHADSSRCYAIQAAGLRARCLAEVRR